MLRVLAKCSAKLRKARLRSFASHRNIELNKHFRLLVVLSFICITIYRHDKINCHFIKYVPHL